MERHLCAPVGSRRTHTRVYRGMRQLSESCDLLPFLDELIEKWDWALPDDLLRKAYASLYMNIEEALSWARRACPNFCV